MTEKLSEKMREDVKWRRQYKTYEIDDLVPIVEALEAEAKDAIDAGEEWRTKWIEEESWRKGLEARLAKAQSRLDVTESILGELFVEADDCEIFKKYCKICAENDDCEWGDNFPHCFVEVKSNE